MGYRTLLQESNEDRCPSYLFLRLTFLGNKMTKADVRINEKIEEIAKKRGTSMAIVSMAWSLAKPYISSPIIGMSSGAGCG
jgi:aryl-alcohol dehydrogenase-like predicted oxidoreductase